MLVVFWSWEGGAVLAQSSMGVLRVTSETRSSEIANVALALPPLGAAWAEESVPAFVPYAWGGFRLHPTSYLPGSALRALVPAFGVIVGYSCAPLVSSPCRRFGGPSKSGRCCPLVWRQCMSSAAWWPKFLPKLGRCRQALGDTRRLFGRRHPCCGESSRFHRLLNTGVPARIGAGGMKRLECRAAGVVSLFGNPPYWAPLWTLVGLDCENLPPCACIYSAGISPSQVEPRSYR